MRTVFTFSVYLFFLLLLRRQCYGEETFIPQVDLSECAGKTVCDKVQNYPHEYIEELIKRLSNPVAQLLADDHDVHHTEPSHFKDLVRRKRNVSTSDDKRHEIKPTCATNKKTTKVVVVKNSQDEWQFVVDPFTIIYEECKIHSTECHVPFLLKNSIKSYCKQNYTSYRVMTLKSDGNILQNYFLIPTNCVCALHLSDNVIYKRER